MSYSPLQVYNYHTSQIFSVEQSFYYLAFLSIHNRVMAWSPFPGRQWLWWEPLPPTTLRDWTQLASLTFSNCGFISPSHLNQTNNYTFPRLTPSSVLLIASVFSFLISSIILYLNFHFFNTLPLLMYAQASIVPRNWFQLLPQVAPFFSSNSWLRLLLSFFFFFFPNHKSYLNSSLFSYFLFSYSLLIAYPLHRE